MTHKYEFDLVEEFQAKADWRRRVAEEHPNDERNPEAARCFDDLVKTVSDCPEQVKSDFFNVFSSSDDPTAPGDDWAELLRQVGFGYYPANTEELLRYFIDEQARD